MKTQIGAIPAKSSRRRRLAAFLPHHFANFPLIGLFLSPYWYKLHLHNWEIPKPVYGQDGQRPFISALTVASCPAIFAECIYNIVPNWP